MVTENHLLKQKSRRWNKIWIHFTEILTFPVLDDRIFSSLVLYNFYHLAHNCVYKMICNCTFSFHYEKHKCTPNNRAIWRIHTHHHDCCILICAYVYTVVVYTSFCSTFVACLSMIYPFGKHIEIVRLQRGENELSPNLPRKKRCNVQKIGQLLCHVFCRENRHNRWLSTEKHIRWNQGNWQNIPTFLNSIRYHMFRRYLFIRNYLKQILPYWIIIWDGKATHCRKCANQSKPDCWMGKRTVEIKTTQM